MTTSLFVGVDAGKSGAVAFYTPPNPPQIYAMPLGVDNEFDAEAFLNLIHGEVYGEDGTLPPPTTCVTEYTFRPNSLVAMTGGIRAVASLCCDEVVVVPVATWKKAVYGVSSSDKQISIDWALKTWPTLDLKRTPRAKGPSHDFAEAAALAYYGWLIHQQRGQR